MIRWVRFGVKVLKERASGVVLIEHEHSAQLRLLPPANASLFLQANLHRGVRVANTT